LPSGNLKIIVNRLGFTGDSTNVNVTSTSNIDSINFHLYRFTVGIKQIGIEVPNEFKLYQNYPNPFNPVTKIKFEIPSNGFPIGAFGNDRVVLKIYDILGREIQTLVNESLQPGSYEVTFDGSSLSSGIYFYQLKAGDYIETKKMLMIK
jgi:5-hydroxyisourate hydrolase-like protein (transthyretin family)